MAALTKMRVQMQQKEIIKKDRKYSFEVWKNIFQD